MSREQSHWPVTLFVLCCLAILATLGVWQLERRAWKHELINKIETRLHDAPVDLPQEMENPGAWEYRRVKLSGQFMHDHEMYLTARVMNGQMGYQIVTPLRTADHGYVLVNRGWIPLDKKDPATRYEGQIEGQVALTGILRIPSKPGWMQPENEPRNNLWFHADPAAMARHAGLDQVQPVIIEADATPNPGGLPIGGQTIVNLPDNHLVYAVTWFSLALVLIVIYVRYRRLRE